MICYNTADYNLAKIKYAANLGRVPLKDDYQVYGIKEVTENPQVRLTFSPRSDIRRQLHTRGVDLKKFFEKIGIRFEHTEVEDHDNYCAYDYGYGSFKIMLGLRKDVRKNISLSVAIIKTVIFSIDRGLTLSKTLKLPRFTTVESTEESAVKKLSEPANVSITRAWFAANKNEMLTAIS